MLHEQINKFLVKSSKSEYLGPEIKQYRAALMHATEHLTEATDVLRGALVKHSPSSVTALMHSLPHGPLHVLAAGELRQTKASPRSVCSSSRV